MQSFNVSVHSKKAGGFQVSFVHPLTQKRKRKHFTTKKEAEEYKKELILSHDKGLLKTQKLYIGHLIQLHLKECPDSGLTERGNHFRAFYEHFKHFELSAITKPVLRNWFEQVRKDRGLTEKTMCHLKSQFNHFFKWLIDKELTQVNPLDGVKYRQNLAPKKPRVVLSAEELKEMLDGAFKYSPNILYPFLYAIVQTGARRSEVANLCWTDVDFATNRITFRETKNGESRSIEMSKGLRRLLESLRLKDLKHQYVFINEEGRKLHRQKIHRMVTRLKRLYPIPGKDWGCHSLRHSFAYNFLKKGGKMYELKAILGHKTIAMTVDLYGNLRSHDVSNPSPYDF